MVCGGMYRGEPPKAFFSKDWSSMQDFGGAGANLHLVGHVGVSSTLPPAKWAWHWEYPSDGQRAFIKEADTRKSQLRSRSRKKDYVLGRTRHGTGYYHMETREAEIAMAMGCCPRSLAWIQEQQVKLTAMREVRDVLAHRVAASSPRGECCWKPNQPHFSLRT